MSAAVWLCWEGGERPFVFPTDLTGSFLPLSEVNWHFSNQRPFLFTVFHAFFLRKTPSCASLLRHTVMENPADMDKLTGHLGSQHSHVPVSIFLPLYFTFALVTERIRLDL